MRDTARVIVTSRCPRQCVGCCNEQFNDFEDSMTTLFRGATTLDRYSTIVWTGGEPQLVHEELKKAVSNRPTQRHILYTSYASMLSRKDLTCLLTLMDGVTFTFHYKYHSSQAFEFALMTSIIRDVKEVNPDFQAWLSVDSRVGFNMNPVAGMVWNQFKFFDWVGTDECPVPANEDLFYMPMDRA